MYERGDVRGPSVPFGTDAGPESFISEPPLGQRDGSGWPGRPVRCYRRVDLGLWVGARLLVDAVVRLARRFGLSDLTIGLTVVAMGTSTPELAVSLDAAFKRLGDIAVSNVLGSNVYNLASILGVISPIRMIPIAESLVHRDGLALLVSTLADGLAVFDLEITRLEGLVLVGLFVAYTLYLLRTGRPSPGRPNRGRHPRTR